MTVRELSKDELDELRDVWWLENGRYYEPEDVPNEVLYDKYDGIDFVPDDFFCNLYGKENA